MRRSVLVVEDEEDIREITADVLKDAGYDVVTVSTGEAALARLVEDADISLLLTDILMPGPIDGWALADRATASRPDLRVIYMTAFALVPPNNPGHGPLLPKPWTAGQLLECVERVFAAPPGDVHGICR